MVNSPNQAIPQTPQTTGRFLVLFREGSVDAGVRLLNESARISVFGPGETRADNTIMLEHLGVAVVDANPEQLRSVRLATEDYSPILAVEPEQILYALQDSDPFLPIAPPITRQSSISADYLQGYRDAVNHLVDHLLGRQDGASAEQQAPDEAVATWGLQATNVITSCQSGRGIKVAVLDTGFELNHPDFVGRTIQTQSFIEGEDAQDANGHGTHCIGTSCGPRKPTQLPRYGIAYNAEIFVGKVLGNDGSGSDGGILQGIEWAITNGCHVISMSLGAPSRVGTPYSPIYEAVAQRALSQGTLIIAAAGNESRRRTGVINPVARPANCPSIMAVAALDSALQVAVFSNRGLNPEGGQIDIAGPGVDIYSSWLLPTQYRRISGTSMATPHVAGIAALHAEISGLRGQELWNLLTKSARRLSLPSDDVGAGLAQAPAE